MKREPSKAWEEFCAKAGTTLKKSGGKTWDVLKTVGAKVWAALKAAGRKTWAVLKVVGAKTWAVLKKVGIAVGKAIKRAAILLGRLLAAGGRRVWAWLKANFGMEPREALEVVGDGLFARNPLLVLALGVTCALAATTDLRSAVVMACCTLIVLLVSELLVSLLRNVLPQTGRRVCALTINAAVVTAVGMLLNTYFPAEAERLTIYLPLLAVNCAVLSRVDGFAGEHIPGYALLDALSNGLGYGAGLAALGALRELLGTGSLWGQPVLGADFQPVLMLAAPCGGFLLLGLLTALAQWLRDLGAGRRGGAEA